MFVSDVEEISETSPSVPEKTNLNLRINETSIISLRFASEMRTSYLYLSLLLLETSRITGFESTNKDLATR